MTDETPPRWGLIIALAVVIWLLTTTPNAGWGPRETRR
jgi:hypothetical protein